MKKAMDAILTCLLFCGPVFGTTVDVLVYSHYPVSPETTRLNSIDGINATGTNNINDITLANLANYDVFYAGTYYQNNLDSKAGVIQSFLSNGGGVIVGQSNITGAIDWLPTGLEASVASEWFLSTGYFELTGSGSMHPIFDGLSTSDFGEGPADIIHSYDLSPGWDVLMVHSSNPDIIGLAAGTYGNGRILLWPGHFASTQIQPPSDDFIRQALQWTSVPEPSSVLIFSLGCLIIRKKCLNRSLP